MNLLLTQTAFNKMVLAVTGNTAVDIFNATVTGLTVVSMTILGTGGETVEFNPAGGKFVVYDLVKNDPILQDGDIIEIEFDVAADAYGQYPIEISDAVGAGTDATLEPIQGVTATLAVGFSAMDVTKTVAQILGLGSEGIDANGDGNVNIADLQIIISNLI